MDTQARILLGAIIVLTLIAAGIYLAPTIDEKILQPKIVGAWVALQVDGAAVADIGVVRLTAGTPFTLHAVLEARDRRDRPVYYTRAPGLRFLGDAGGGRGEVEAEALRLWDRRGVVRVRWFTIEGPGPFLRLEDGEGADAFALERYVRADWPTGWSAPGSVEPAFDDRLDLGSRLMPAEQIFGTQRYHVRVEIYRDEEDVFPLERYASPGAEELRAAPADFSTAIASLPDPAGPASRVFGLTQIEPPAGTGGHLSPDLVRLDEAGLAFTRLTVLRDQLRLAVDPQAPWSTLDLDQRPAWGEAVAMGDLLRVGERVVVVYDDRGEAGVLDTEDLCFDYVAGATVRRISDVFTGGESVLEHRVLGR